MDRQDFLKSMLALTGTAFVYGCNDVIDVVPSNEEDLSELTISNSQKWFSNSYMPTFQDTSARKNAGLITRKLDWDKGVQVKKNTEDFVWVPITYDSARQLPTLVTWKDGQEYIPELAQYLKWSIAEGFIVYKDKKGSFKGFMAQVAYDPFKHKPGKVIDSGHFTGMLIHADWDESPLRVWRYLDGKLESHFDSEKNRSGRIAQCFSSYYSYQTVTGQSCGPNCWETTVTLHRDVYTYCDDPYSGGGSGQGSQGYPYYGGGGSGGSGIVTPPTSSVYSPYIHYDFNKVALKQGADYQLFMQRTYTTLTTLSISASTFGWSSTYADVFVKTLGIEDAWVVGTAKTLKNVTQVIGWAGIAVGGFQIIIGLTDGEITQGDVLNVVGLGLGILSVATPIGWLALTAGAVSAGISIYTTAHP